MNGTQQFPQGTQGMQGGQGGFPQGGPPGGFGGPGRGMGFLPGGPFATYIVIALFAITLVVLAVAFYRLFQKAGFTGVIGLLMLVPIVNLGVALYLAFAEWPIVAELARTRLLLASGGSALDQTLPAGVPAPAGPSAGAPAMPLSS